MNKKLLVLGLVLFAVPSLVSAQCGSFPSGSSYEKICLKVIDVGCKIILLIQGIVGGVAALVLVLAGIQWISSAFYEDPQRRAEAKERIVNTFIGLLIVVVALELIGVLFGSGIGSFSC